jgi:lipoate-protein ligase A
MQNAKVYETASTDPFLNLATEDWLFHDMLDGAPLLFLWQNDNTIVIGRAQNPWVECNTVAMGEDDVILARRQSGGGAVYHDLGNLNFTFMNPTDTYDKKINIQIILTALKACGIEAKASGRNDILVEHDGDKKISGSAFRESKDRAFHHGTLLFDSNLDKLQTYLTPPAKKLKSKGVTSVRSRVTNLKDVAPSLTLEQLKTALTQAFCEHYNAKVATKTFTPRHIENLKPIKARVDQLCDWDWRYGKTLQFEHELDEQFSWGHISAHLNVRHAIIHSAKFYSDCLHPEVLPVLEPALAELPYRATDLFALPDTLGLTGETHSIAVDICAWLAKSIH